MSSRTGPEISRTWSLVARLTAWYAGSGFLLVLTSTAFLYWILSSNLDREDDELLTDKVNILRVLLRERGENSPVIKQQVEWEGLASQNAQFYMRVLDSQGTVIIETPGMAKFLPQAVFASSRPAGSGNERGKEVHSTEGRLFRILTANWTGGPDESTARLVQVALDRTREEELMAGYRNSMWLVLAFALACCAAVGYVIARRGLQPVADITATTRHIGSSTLHERVALGKVPAELSELATTFNAMLDRLEDAFTRLARFSADIAHELRTPVQNLRGEVEVALGRERTPAEYREVLESALEESARLARMIDSLLFLARAENPGQQIFREAIDMSAELIAVRDYFEAAATEAAIDLRVTPATGNVVARVDRTLFQRAVSNLIANALASTPAGGAIVLTLGREREGIVVEVADTGPGIDPIHLPHVFDRFYRVDPARTNSQGRVGLGLPIVKTIMHLHGGTVTLTSEPGQGTCVRLLFASP